MNALSDYLMKSGREEAGVLLGAYEAVILKGSLSDKQTLSGRLCRFRLGAGSRMAD